MTAQNVGVAASRDRVRLAAAITTALALCAAPARAQRVEPPSSRNEIAQPNEPASDDDRDIATATPDPTPPPRPLDLAQEPEVDVIEQAGVGGPVPFGATGVFELGGSGFFAGNETELWASLRPFVGLFVMDGLELGLSNEILIRFGAPDDQLSAALLGTVDSNAYLPLDSHLWLQLGVSVGAIYNGLDGGVVGTARAGLAVLVGRSAIIHFVANGGAASVPFASPVQIGSSGAHFRVGGEVTFAALF